ncbi:acetyl/propionyl/methylcrotonyl-CoA carboxylase subunit alpha [Brevibacterium yomogidense]|uniref:acetyl/propionyl/methylcrotonyl-CoA carboxylase subunit alpha n=1 Tax=Brevibacterium yomogidense TaxID=946573 RepID=UPI0018E05450|nr:biotin carboxylase N-terminal domain-containing protein [Brevibacterium yomogidense]
MTAAPAASPTDRTAIADDRPVRRVLIANRGEIALRIVRACRDLGIASVAAYTASDADSLFVTLADDAYKLEGACAADTYLSIPTMIELAQRAGADAVHPGYGYLAESGEFATAVAEAGLTWVGAPASAIDALGDKAGAREVAQAVGAPVPQGSPGPVESIREAAEIAETIGYPVAIKAVHGGGGRGFRTAADANALPAAFEAASREAKAAFGRGECLIEQQIVRPRHIETQCLADAKGHVLVVSTRDCTLQRRNQKILEEAPAPGLTDAQEQLLADASVNILRHVGYVGAATCEFLLGADGRITFMEANARIQVEHTITEEIAGIDLVGWQLRIAAGESLPESFPAPRGHAFQFRINAEDPAHGFVPVTGAITSYREPAGPGVRIDSGVQAGTTVGSDFDPMLAKLIVWGPDRATALARSRRAIDEFVFDGVATLLPLHRSLTDAAEFAGQELLVSTRWLEEDFMPDWSADRLPAPSEDGEERAEQVEVVVEVDGHRLVVGVPAALAAPSGRPQRSRRVTKRTSKTAAASGSLTAPMQGTIVAVDVSPGDRVSAGDRLAVIEAMKMEQPLTAAHDAVVRSVAVGPGAGVRSGDLLVEFEV